MPQPDKNELDLLIGFKVENWTTPHRPGSENLEGKYCRLEPLSIERHSASLFAANQRDTNDRIWVYLPYGPFDTLGEYQRWLSDNCFNGDPFFYAIVDQESSEAIGVASYLRIDPTNGSIEVGHINYSPSLQNTIAATEAMYLMMKNAFDLGYRRYEWKCNSLNEKSCSAAKRLGFSYEGIFRQATVTKGRNRDTSWFAMIDLEWPVLNHAFTKWLAEDNFDENGQQRRALSGMTQEALGSFHENND
ncbi:MAG: GNAT family N-acetyltransferase [Gammaproteobacteria bacterium]|nr:GNAT family N-acetyltransferase [Gammaproteobacteria bacterium]NKB65215.1 GNAT family N-acetyltransferase [Gammaproteobacteria bacterium]